MSIKKGVVTLMYVYVVESYLYISYKNYLGINTRMMPRNKYINEKKLIFAKLFYCLSHGVFRLSYLV